MALDAAWQIVFERLRKIALQFTREIGIVGAAACPRARDLSAILPYRAAAPAPGGQAAAFTRRCSMSSSSGQELDRAIEFAVTLEPAQQLLIARSSLNRAAAP